MLTELESIYKVIIHMNLLSFITLYQDSKLIAGVAFKKTFSYAGFEMQPKKYSNPQIALLNVELELKAEKDNAEIRVDSVEVGGDPGGQCGGRGRSGWTVWR